MPTPVVANANSPPDVPRKVYPRRPEARAIARRTLVIRRDADGIDAQCRKAANGDWDRWQRDTAPYRTALRAKVEALQELKPPPAPWLDCKYELLEGREGFPLLEVAARDFLRYLYEPEILYAFQKARAVQAVKRWLSRRGIDLIFVPVPKMTEVYVEHFLEPSPPDGIIAPHLRRLYLDLLNDDVETIDGWPLFRELRDTDTEYLYNAADAHWAPRAMRIMAKEIADRIVRYDFGARARYALPIVKSSPGPYPIPGMTIDGRAGEMRSQYAWPALKPEQRRRAEAAQTTNLAHVTMQDGREPPDDPESPVLLVGNSYVRGFREQLIKELNLLVATNWRPASTTEMIADFLRYPKQLVHCRVIVWVVADGHLTGFKPLPDVIYSENDAEEHRTGVPQK